MRKPTHFKVAWFHLRMAVGFLFLAIGASALPVSFEKTTFTEKLDKYVWEAAD